MAKHTEFGPLAIGLFCGFLVYLVHGLLDCVTHSTKPGIVIWAIIGLAWRFTVSSTSEIGPDDACEA